MPVKQWIREHQPLQLYVVLAFTIIFFVIELIVSHTTHCLTLLMNSYQMLCNILALTGYIVTIKFQNKEQQPAKKPDTPTEDSKSEKCTQQNQNSTKDSSANPKAETKLRNTFGWTRMDVISMLICCVFSGSLCFSLFVEAIQTIVHLNHFHEMHQPISVLLLGVCGIFMNIGCYFLIGGYTFHQGSFLYVNKSGDVVLNQVTTVSDTVRQGERRLSKTRTLSSDLKQRQGFREMCKDVLGCILVIISALSVYFAEEAKAKYMDPAISVLHAFTLVYLSFPYMKESCFILLQTMPGSIDIESLKKDLIRLFPDIKSVHDFHIWQLTARKVISTVHIIFENPQDYILIIAGIKDFFSINGITQVTIQPEFFTKSLEYGVVRTKNRELECLMKCKGGCESNLCCPPENEHEYLREIYCKETLPEYGSLPNLQEIRLSEESRPSVISKSADAVNDDTLLTTEQRAQNTIGCTKEEIKNRDNIFLKNDT